MPDELLLATTNDDVLFSILSEMLAEICGDEGSANAVRDFIACSGIEKSGRSTVSIPEETDLCGPSTTSYVEIVRQRIQQRISKLFVLTSLCHSRSR